MEGAGVYTSLRITVGIYFSSEKIQTFLFKDESVGALRCGLCTTSNIEKKLKIRSIFSKFDFTDDHHKVVLKNGDFKVECRDRKKKFFHQREFIKNLDLKCEEDNFESYAIRVDFKYYNQYRRMPECLGKNNKNIYILMNGQFRRTDNYNYNIVNHINN